MSEEWERYGIDGFVDPIEIGRGGFGVVYRARQPSLERVVAVKVIGQAQRRSRVETELRALGSLSGHPHIVTVYSHGESPNGYLYIVMDHLSGGSLRDSGELGPEEVAATGVKLAGALETAHRRGILHRDIKPANVLVNAFGEPQLADFGIARLVSAESSSTGQMTGTLAHTPAELLEGEEATARSDVFSLGSTLYSALAGHPPFMETDATSVANLLYRIVQGSYPDLRARGVPGPLADVIDAMLARDALARPASARAAGESLQQAQAALGWSTTPLVAGAADGSTVTPIVATDSVERLAVSPGAPTAAVSGPPPPDAVPTSGQAGEGGRTRRRRLMAVAGSMLGVVVVLAGISLALARGDGDRGAGAIAEVASPDDTSTTPPTVGVAVTEAPTELVPKPEVRVDLADLVTFPNVTFAVEHPDLRDLTLAVGVLDAQGQRLCEIPLAMPDGAGDQQSGMVSASIESCSAFLPPSPERPWFLRVIDGPGEGTGVVTAFALALEEDVMVAAESVPADIPANDLQGLVLLVPVGQDEPVPTEGAAGPVPVGPPPAAQPVRPQPAPQPAAPQPAPQPAAPQPAPQPAAPQPAPQPPAPQPQPPAPPPDPPPTSSAD